LDIDGHTLDFLANCENVIAVGATQQNKNRPNFSNYGIKLDVSAIH
jgi:subtilisin family serine protease